MSARTGDFLSRAIAKSKDTAVCPECGHPMRAHTVSAGSRIVRCYHPGCTVHETQPAGRRKP